ncbi:MAG: hypothetical protein ACP5OV_01695 [Acidimicrobiales bacterium]
MAKSTTGKWVSRVGAAGGGRSYRRSRPVNFYGVIGVVVILGLASVVLARYDYQHPQHHHAAPAVAPKIGTTWYAALGVDDCGTRVADLPVGTSTGGLSLLASNVIKVSPISSADAGNNATLAQFSRENPGVTATATNLDLTTVHGHLRLATGQRCAAGTPDAGKTGRVVYAYWPTLSTTRPTLTTKPGGIKFAQYLRVTLAFVPQGVTPLAPTKATVNAMVQVNVTPTTTTTTPPVTTTTPAPVTSTTVGPTTTVPGSTSTTTTTSKG